MSWVEELVKTYDANEALAGRTDVEGSKAVLPPIGHIVQNAQIEIHIDMTGNFMGARVIAKDNQPTLIPCTPDSASRTSKPSPHPLAEHLEFIARDYEPMNQAGASSGESLYQMYCHLLGNWVASPYVTQELEAVYRYILEHDAIDDLCTCEPPVLFRDDGGKILQKWPYKDKPKPPIFSAVTGDILKALVRFVVQRNDGTEVPLWLDTQLQKKYQQFLLYSFGKELSLCYATGKMMPVTEKHNKGIRYPGDGAKLISSNDTAGFTFRGRFTDSKECVSIGYETSQKAINALMWLIRNQGYIVDGRVFLAWSTLPVPSLFEDTDTFLSRYRQHFHRAYAQRPNTMQAWAENLQKALSGYKHEFEKDKSQQVNLMVLDAATPGRLSICYYDALSGKAFLQRIELWHHAGSWLQHGYTHEGDKAISYFGVPTPRTLIKACRGDNISDKRLKMELERIFYCIVQGRSLPQDMEQAVKRRVVHTAVQATGRQYEQWRYHVLEPACSVICNRLYGQRAKEAYTVALDEENHNRSYLYGRMLAVADRMERITFKKEEQGRRLTNAMKYMEAFSARPATTWQTIQKRLLPYELKCEQYGGYERRRLNQIGSMFEEKDFLSDMPLDGRFLLGFYCQQYADQQAAEERRKRRMAQQAQQQEQEVK